MLGPREDCRRLPPWGGRVRWLVDERLFRRRRLGSEDGERCGLSDEEVVFEELCCWLGSWR